MKRALRHQILISMMSCIALMIAPAFARAQVVALPSSVFSGLTPLTFSGLADGLEVNGLVVGGITFSYSLGNGNLVIDGGPGITNNVNPPNVVSIGNPNGTLTLILPGFQDMFGFGYALLTFGQTPNATAITAFSGVTNLGTVSFTSNNDPLFTGGFAGIGSAVPFDRVQFSFGGGAPAFALDNVRTHAAGGNISTVPEPTTALFVSAGLMLMIVVARKRRP